METRHSNTRLSIYGMGDAPTFVIKGDTPTFVMGDGSKDAHFCDKRICAPRNTRLLFFYNQRHVIAISISLSSEKRAHLVY
jgi:hypothetical protein